MLMPARGRDVTEEQTRVVVASASGMDAMSRWSASPKALVDQRRSHPKVDAQRLGRASSV